jgi:hypothetical protein
MTTATGDISRNYAAQGNANPWVDADFTNRNSMTAIIASNALKSNLNTDGFYSYTAALPDQNTWHTKGEKVFSSGTFDDHVGVGGITSAGNGYILQVNGNQWRIYKVNAFVLAVIGGGTNITHSAFDVIGLKYSYAAGTVTLTATLNGVDTAKVETDSSSPYNSGLESCWYFNYTNNNGNGFRSIAADGFAAEVTIDDIDSPIRVTEPVTARITVAATAPTTGNTDVYVNADTNAAITPDSVTLVSGLIYDVVFAVPDEYAGLPYSATGYPVIISTVDGDATSDSIPFLPVTGNDYVTLTDVSATDIESSPALEVDDQIEWTNADVITIGDEGKVTSLEASATFEFRVWDHNDSTWGAWAEQTWGGPTGTGGLTGNLTRAGFTSGLISIGLTS